MQHGLLPHFHSFTFLFQAKRRQRTGGGSKACPLAESPRCLHLVEGTRTWASSLRGSTGSIPKYTNCDPFRGRLSYTHTIIVLCCGAGCVREAKVLAARAY